MSVMSTNSKIINRVISETASKEEAKEVAGWFSSTIEGQQCLSDMLDRDAYLMDADADSGKSFTPLQSDLLFRRIDKDIRIKRLRTVTRNVAAVLVPILFLLGLGYFIHSQTSFFQGTTYAELYIPKGEDARIFFQDGTEVFLNADTKIRYPEHFGFRHREVYLDGEAYFNVAPDRKRPFVVHAQNTSVEVLGTAFNVNAYSESETIQVVLDEGKTSFQVQQSKYTMSPGQQIEYNKTTGKTSLYNLSKPSNVSLWRKNVLYFYDTPLAEVIKTVERKYNVHFHVQSPEALNFSYTLTTKQLHLEDLLNELQKIAPVKFQYKGDNVFVSI